MDSYLSTDVVRYSIHPNTNNLSFNGHRIQLIDISLTFHFYPVAQNG